MHTPGRPRGFRGSGVLPRRLISSNRDSQATSECDVMAAFRSVNSLATQRSGKLLRGGSVGPGGWDESRRRRGRSFGAVRRMREMPARRGGIAEGVPSPRHEANSISSSLPRGGVGRSLHPVGAECAGGTVGASILRGFGATAPTVASRDNRCKSSPTAADREATSARRSRSSSGN